MNPTGNNILQRQIVVFFEVHQPRRLRTFSQAQPGEKKSYFDDQLNESIMKRVAHDCYEPANAMLLKLVTKQPGIKVCFSISGEALDQMEKYAPDVLENFKALATTGAIELFAETSYHSLGGLLAPEEFQAQIVKHVEKIRHHFNVSPTVFCNAELIYNDEIGRCVGEMGFRGIVCEGADKIVGSGGKNKIYRHPEEPIKLLLRNDALSDQIVSRFGAGQATLTVDSVIASIDSLPADSLTVVLGLDYEALGEHFKRDAGIINFIHDLLVRFSSASRFMLSTASEVIFRAQETDSLSIIESVSWSANGKDLSSWLGNDMQQEAFELLAGQQDRVALVEDESLVDIWRSLQTSDHFFYMSSHKLGDDSHRSYFSQYPSPYEAFINYMNILKDFISNVEGARQKEADSDHAKLLESERQHPKTPVWAMKRELQTRLASEPKP